MQLPEAILQYWQSNSALPPLYYEYSPEDAAIPHAVFYPVGFSREYQNEYLRMDNYQYEFVVLGYECDIVYTTGFEAVTFMDSFEYNGLIQVTPQPQAMATPTRAGAGQKTQWEYKFSMNFLLQPTI